MNYIQETQTEEGVDFVILKDGRVLGIDLEEVRADKKKPASAASSS
jgi:hypothetical protein